MPTAHHTTNSIKIGTKDTWTIISFKGRIQIKTKYSAPIGRYTRNRNPRTNRSPTKIQIIGTKNNTARNIAFFIEEVTINSINYRTSCTRFLASIRDELHLQCRQGPEVLMVLLALQMPAPSQSLGVDQGWLLSARVADQSQLYSSHEYSDVQFLSAIVNMILKYASHRLRITFLRSFYCGYSLVIHCSNISAMGDQDLSRTNLI